MKINWNKRYTTYAIYASMICAAIIFCVFVGIYINHIWSGFLFVLNVFTPLLYGCIITYILSPVMRLFERWLLAKIKHVMIRRGISVLLTYIVFIAALVLLVYAVAPQLVQSLNELQKNLAVYSDSLQEWLASVSQNSPLLASIVNGLMKYIDLSMLSQPLEQLIQSMYELIIKFSPYILDFISAFMVQLKNIIIGLIFAGYLLCYKELVLAQVKKLLNAFLKRNTIKKIGNAFRTTDKTFGQYLIGTFLDAIIVGILTAVALIIFKIPYVPLISVLIACTNIIPIFGPFIGAIPSFIFIFISSPLKAIWFVAIILVIQQIDGNIIAPRVLGGTTGLPAIAVISAIIVMGGLFGVVGMIIGVPVFALIGKFLHAKTEQRAMVKAMAGGETDSSDSSDESRYGDDDVPEQLKFVIVESNASDQSESAEENPENIVK